tara:strand:- start:985 stop:1248 length:264 start_codon:yes stop_codon:yes gene_type:complete
VVSRLAIKKDHSKIMGVDFDPKGDMSVDVKPDGDCEVKYKGSKMDYDTYVDELEDRSTRIVKGKSISEDIGTFSGVSFDKNGKIIRN